MGDFSSSVGCFNGNRKSRGRLMTEVALKQQKAPGTILKPNPVPSLPIIPFSKQNSHTESTKTPKSQGTRFEDDRVRDQLKELDPLGKDSPAPATVVKTYSRRPAPIRDTPITSAVPPIRTSSILSYLCQPVTPAYAPAPYVPLGMVNTGNTCYANAVLQVLFSLDTFTSDLSNAALDASRETAAACVLRALTACWKEHCSARESLPFKGSGAVECAELLRRALSSRSALWRHGLQQDAHEFMCAIMEAVTEEVLAAEAASKCSSSVRVSETRCPAVRTFSGTVRHTLLCSHCGARTSVREHFNHLSLQLAAGSAVTDLQQLLQDNFQDETVEKSCESCGAASVPHRVRHAFTRLPRVMALHLKRFTVQQDTLGSGGGFRSTKMRDTVRPSTTLGLGNLCAEGSRAPALLLEHLSPASLQSLLERQCGKENKPRADLKDQTLSYEPTQTNRLVHEAPGQSAPSLISEAPTASSLLASQPSSAHAPSPRHTPDIKTSATQPSLSHPLHTSDIEIPAMQVAASDQVLKPLHTPEVKIPGVLQAAPSTVSPLAPNSAASWGTAVENMSAQKHDLTPVPPVAENNGYDGLAGGSCQLPPSVSASKIRDGLPASLFAHSELRWRCGDTGGLTCSPRKTPATPAPTPVSVAPRPPAAKAGNPFMRNQIAPLRCSTFFGCKTMSPESPRARQPRELGGAAPIDDDGRPSKRQCAAAVEASGTSMELPINLTDMDMSLSQQEDQELQRALEESAREAEEQAERRRREEEEEEQQFLSLVRSVQEETEVATPGEHAYGENGSRAEAMKVDDMEEATAHLPVIELEEDTDEDEDPASRSSTDQRDQNPAAPASTEDRACSRPASTTAAASSSARSLSPLQDRTNRKAGGDFDLTSAGSTLHGGSSTKVPQPDKKGGTPRHVPLTAMASYSLHGIVSHIGSSVGSGHFVADIHNPKTNLWYRHDDSVVRPLPLDTILYDDATDGYLLFYLNSAIIK